MDVIRRMVRRKQPEASSGSCSSCGGTKKRKQPMDLRTTKEQKLYMDVLQTTAIPRGGNDINWLSIDLWNAVTDEYNRRAPQCGVVERTMPSLIQLGKKLRYCNCMTGQKCSCPVPEFPIIDGPGEPSSHVSLGTGSASHNSHLAANEASHTLQTVASELMRLRKEAMESESKCILVLAGKSATEKELANSMKASNILKLPDIEDVSVLLHSESRNEESFRVNSYMNSLSTKCFGRFFIWSPRLPSTHDVVSKNFGELPVGSVCVADLQYKGRGRSMNVWESPKGCLLFSFTIQIEDGKIVPLIQYVVSLAMTEAIHDVCTKDGVPYLDVRIKWPNDLYIDGLKVGGILCTSTYRSKKFNVSAGLGLNVDNEKPTTSLNAVLRKLTSDSYQLQREDIISAFFNKFEIFFNLFMDQGFKPLEELYYNTWLHSGQRVIVEEKNDDKDLGRQSVVTVQGLTSSGYLLAVGDDNQMCELHPDGNSFDFFKGLIRRKLA